MKTTRPRFESFKAKALKNPEVKAEYEALKPSFELKKQMINSGREAHLTQEELAHRIGTDKGYISRIERGLTIPTVATLYKIVAAMGMTIELKPI